MESDFVSCRLVVVFFPYVAPCYFGVLCSRANSSTMQKSALRNIFTLHYNA